MVYIIYILGLIGNFKGVLILYLVFGNFFESMVLVLGFSDKDRLFVVIILLFDILMLEFLFLVI